jgi:Nif-specific regulatory protein
MAVADVGRELAAPGDLDTRLEAALRVLDRRLGASRSVLIAIHPEHQRLVVRAAFGIASDQFRPQRDAGVAGRVIATGQPVVVPVVRHDPMALSELTDLTRWQDAGWNLVAMPVLVAGRNVAALCAYFRHRDSSGFADRLSALDVVAALIGKASRAAQTVVAKSDATEPVASEPARRERASSEAIFEYANMVGESQVMRQVYEQVGQVARTNATALLRGESGTGKELVAHAIHHNSPRAAQPFVKLNCAALPDALFESELFGHERGAFTGAHSRKKGRFELAHGGTLFLDEIGELSLAAQAKLLRALQFREFERVGGTETLRTDVRIVAATNVDMEAAVSAGSFREDLYYRINIFTIMLPPLRERRADIPALADYFLGKWAVEHQRNKITRIANSALDLLSEHSWPGNVRELENVIERAVVVCNGSVIQEQHLPHALRTGARPTERLTLSEAVERLERQLIEEALRNANGNVAAAARVLGTTERVVRYKAQKLGIDTARLRPSGQ